MSLKIDRLQLEIVVNNDQSRVSLRKLTDEANKLKRELKKLPEGSQEFIEKSKRLKTVQQQYDNVLEKIGITGLSLKELTNRQRELNLMMRHMDPRLPEYKKLDKQLTAVKNRMKELRGTAVKTHFSIGKMADNFNRYFGLLSMWAATFAGVFIGFRKLIDMANNFEERVDNLSALTGLMGKELDWLSKKAKETSIDTVEGNIRIKQSADAIVDAYTKVGSQRPELLKNKEALHDVTLDAIILSEAAKSDLEPAVAGLTMAMNQFKMEASDSDRIINAMAAGSKEGAADIPYLTKAYEKSGTTARLMGIQIEEATGAIEAIAPSYSRAEMAGNSFDKVLLKMKAKGIGYVNGVFNLNRAIMELEKMYQSGTSSTDLFGVEHAKMGELLVQNRKDIIRYTNAVTGTNIAIEQASKNTDNNAAKLAQAKNRFALIAIELGEKLAPAMTFSTNAFSYLVKAIMAGIKIFNEYRGIIIAAAVAIPTYTAATKIAVLWETRHNSAKGIGLVLSKAQVIWTAALRSGTLLYAAAKALLTGNTIRATAAMRLFNLTSKLNPYALIATAVATLIVYLATYRRKLDEAAAAQKAMNEVKNAGLKAVADEKVKLQALLKVAKDETKSKEDRLAAIQKLRDISPEYLGNLDLETINTDKATTAIEKYIAAIEQKAKAQAAYDKLVEIEKKLLDLQANGAELTFFQKAKNSMMSFGNVSSMVYKNASDAISNLREEEKNLLAQKEALMEFVTDNPDYINPDPAAGNGGGGNKEVRNNRGQTFEEWQLEQMIWRKQKNRWLEENPEEPETAEEEDVETMDEFALASNPKLAQALLEEEYKRRMYEETDEYQRQLLADMLARNEISQSEYNDRIAALDDKAHDKKRQQWKDSLGIVKNVFGEQTAAHKAAMIAEKAMALEEQARTLGIIGMKIEEGKAKTAAAAPFPANIPLILGFMAQVGGLVASVASMQFASGNYLDVIGAKDGRNYHAKVSPGNTGIYNSPTFIPGLGLVSEYNQRELVFSGPDTDRILNTPALINAINHTIGVQQFAEGNAAAMIGNQSPQQPTTDPQMLTAISQLNAILANGILANISYTQVEDSINEVNTIRKDVGA